MGGGIPFCGDGFFVEFYAKNRRIECYDVCGTSFLDGFITLGIMTIHKVTVYFLSVQKFNALVW